MVLLGTTTKLEDGQRIQNIIHHTIPLTSMSYRIKIQIFRIAAGQTHLNSIKITNQGDIIIYTLKSL